ncbi:hypothetical protein [Faecalibacterium sp.]|jgi:hypothetical protein|uniref:hypothetical protein n=1 Tax=Faecalibacterium sp. TaxID=1971605 RepID=UPI003991F2D9
MTTSRIYAYRWPARLVSHKPFAAESYSITPSCIWQVFFRKKNEFSFLFSPFCQRAHFLCKMHNPQAFLPVENSAVPAAQCLVWTVLPLLYIYNKKQRRRSRRKQALQMPFAFTTPPVKKSIGKIRRFSRLANLK